MEDRSGNNSTDSQNDGFPAFLIKRVFVAMICIAAVIYVLAVGIDYLETSNLIPQSATTAKAQPPATAAQPKNAPPVTVAAAAPAVQLQFDPAQSDAKTQSRPKRLHPKNPNHPRWSF